MTIPSDADLLTLCVLQEAGNQCMDGKAAVARVVLNRTRLRYSSDGTISSTILWPSQFSWCEFAMVDGTYERVANGSVEVGARVAKLMAQAKAEAVYWRAAAAIVGEVMAGQFRSALYDQITPQTVLYDNLSLTKPAWVAKSKFVVKIGAHSFFEPAVG